MSEAASTYNISSALIAEMEQEAIATRKCLERIPTEKFDWKPHEKSMSFGQLAGHVAEIYGWTPVSILKPELNIEEWEYKPYYPQTTEELVDFFDKNMAEAFEVLRSTPDSVFMEIWKFRDSERVYFSVPKAVVMRSFVINHYVHHRGQLSVYLRLNDIPVPSIYGPSADEQV